VALYSRIHAKSGLLCLRTQNRPYAWGMKQKPLFLPLSEMAEVAGVPVAWLRGQADAGKIPSLVVGSRRLFNPAAVEQALLCAAENKKKSQGVARA
jgi:hypothetical protein